MISAILACDQNGGIGYQNMLPWPHLKTDMQMFAKLTSGHIVVMGYATFVSIGKIPLPNRLNIVIINKGDVAEYIYNSCLFLDIDDFARIILCKNQESSPIKKKIFIIGGVRTLNLLIENIDEMYITKIHAEFVCDRHVNLDYIDEHFALQYTSPIIHDNNLQLQFQKYTRQISYEMAFEMNR